MPRWFSYEIDPANPRVIGRDRSGFLEREASERPTSRTQELERDRAEIARHLRRIEALQKLERRLGEEFEGPVSSKYLYPQDKKVEVAGFRQRLQREAEDLINANVRKQAEPERVARNIRRTLRELDIATPKLFRGKRYGAYSYKDVSNRMDDSPRTVFGTEAWREHIVRYGPRSSWQFSTRNFFKTGHLVVPCIERAVRREVIHAKKHNRGHRVKHRSGRFTDIWC